MTKNLFIEITGFIRSVQHVQEDLLLEIWDGKDEQHVTYLVIHKLAIITTLTGEPIYVSHEHVGCYIVAFVNNRKPILAMYPSRFYPELVAVRNDDQFGYVQVGKFNEELMSEELNLKLIVSEETDIINYVGETLTIDEIYNHYMFVYYNGSTRSIPAQAAVKKVIVYDDPFGQMKDQ
ncbi:MAG: hypothetical protein ABS882_14355 [Lysinibacillus sp.]